MLRGSSDTALPKPLRRLLAAAVHSKLHLVLTHLHVSHNQPILGSRRQAEELC